MINRLRAKRIDTLLLAGVTTGGVTLSTPRRAFDLDYRLAVVHDCCADNDPEHHKILLDKIFPTHATMTRRRWLYSRLRGLTAYSQRFSSDHWV